MIAEPQAPCTSRNTHTAVDLDNKQFFISISFSTVLAPPRSRSPTCFTQHDTYTQVGSIHTGLKVDRLLWTKKLLWIEYLDKN
ncbi:unnamed protein product [Plutella xylostella]|uniref:(diamondback moth) hypothetical protein n=1 Tax=Plutella xylostella TaxID=51655 RepID=A0A8S4GF12_PLUXY|nr:unnamed protein product [Plutella xylostella]